ncbi:hypothetical protein [Alteribacillus sp. HJP-4]
MKENNNGFFYDNNIGAGFVWAILIALLLFGSTRISDLTTGPEEG